MNHEELETLGPLKLETYVRIRRCRETAEVDFLIQVDDSLVPPFHEDETLMILFIPKAHSKPILTG